MKPPIETSSPDAPKKPGGGSGFWFTRLSNPQLAGEWIMLAILLGFFGYMLWESFSWRTGGALMPRIIIGIAIPYWIIRLGSVLRQTLRGGGADYQGVRREEETSGAIMDLGFYMGEDARAAIRRFTMIVGAIAVLMIAIVVVGWHIALPTFVALYLYFKANAPWWGAAIGGLFILGIIVGVYDNLFDTEWNDPWAFSWIRTLSGQD